MSALTRAIDRSKAALDEAKTVLPESDYLDFLAAISAEADARFTAIDEADELPDSVSRVLRKLAGESRSPQPDAFRDPLDTADQHDPDQPY